MEIEFIDGGVTAVAGFKAAGLHCGIRKNKIKRDLALILADKECAAAAVYTTNTVKAAPLLLTMENLKDNRAWGIIANSGNANACAPGDMAAAKETIETLARHTNLSPKDFIINSTGVIGQALPVDAITAAIPALLDSLSTEIEPVAEAIMTTDTFPKTAAVKFKVAGKEVTIGGIAKGSGMIHPNMATMFAFLTTNINIEPKLLHEAIKASADCSYNRISVDGDTSTNDMTAILASGSAENPLISEKNEDYTSFLQALNMLNIKLARDIAKDGEGATKLITCFVSGADSLYDAEVISKSVISSSLVKAAMFGEDANIGRVLCAMGYSGGNFDTAKVDISYTSSAGNIAVCKQGIGLAFDEDAAALVLAETEISIEIDLNSGDYNSYAYGCDLTYDYVKINGDYRS